jgi:hypothetical protein
MAAAAVMVTNHLRKPVQLSPLFGEFILAESLIDVTRHARSAGCQACFVCSVPPGGRCFPDRARLRLVGRLGSLRYVRVA